MKIYGRTIFLAILALMCLIANWPKTKPPLNSVEEAKTHFEEHGFYCTIRTPNVGANLIIADHLFDLEEAEDFVSFIGTGLRPTTGKVLLRTEIPEGFEHTPTSRLWGRFWAAGDAALLNRLEASIGIR